MDRIANRIASKRHADVDIRTRDIGATIKAGYRRINRLALRKGKRGAARLHFQSFAGDV